MITLPEKYIKEPTGFPFSPVLAVEGKQIVVTSGAVCEDYDNTIPETMEEQARKTILACERFLQDAGCELTRCIQCKQGRIRNKSVGRGI